MLSNLIETILAYLWNQARNAMARKTSKNIATKSGTSPNPVTIQIGQVLELPGIPDDTGGQSRPVILTPKDFMTGMHVLGASGSGKSHLLLNITHQLITSSSSSSLIVVDLLGDLVDKILDCLAGQFAMEELTERLVLADFRQADWILGLNPLAGEGDAAIRALHTLRLIRLHSPSWGVVIESDALHGLTLLAEAGLSPAYLMLLLENPECLQRVLAVTKDQQARRHFLRYLSLSDREKQMRIAALDNKLVPFFSTSPQLRLAFGLRKAIPFPNLINQSGRIFLCALGGDQEPQTARLLGSHILSSIERTIVGRASQKESERLPTYLFIDEFATLADSQTFELLTAQGRRLACHLIVSHQNLSQIDTRLRQVLRNNIGTSVLMATGYMDASELCHEIYTGEPADSIRTKLVTQKVGQAFLARRSQPSLHIQTNPYVAPPAKAEQVCALKEKALSTWAVPRATAEQEWEQREQILLALTVPAKLASSTTKAALPSSEPSPIIEVHDLDSKRPRLPKRRSRPDPPA